jgi:hypothetical protein
MSENLSRAQRRLANEVLDRIEDRLLDAPHGLHELGDPASEANVLAAGLRLENGLLWTRWNGLALGHGEVIIHALNEIADANDELRGHGWLRPGDVAIGRQGRDWLVCPGDPWQDGGDVVLVGDDGQRAPIASRVERFVLSTLAEQSVLFDEEGEFRADLFDAEEDELNEAARRKVLRRRLDMDADAVLPRFQLASLLRQGGELRGAIAELRHCLKVYPEFAWAHFELGQALHAQGESELASRSFENAAEFAQRPDLAALFLAHAALVSADDARKLFAARVKQADSTFVAERETEAREALAEGDGRSAAIAAQLGLAVEPRHLGLLSISASIEQAVRDQEAEEAEARLAPEEGGEDAEIGEADESNVKGDDSIAVDDGGERWELDLDADDRELGPLTDDQDRVQTRPNPSPASRRSTKKIRR